MSQYFLKSVQDYAKNVTLSNVPDYFQKKKDEGGGPHQV